MCVFRRRLYWHVGFCSRKCSRRCFCSALCARSAVCSAEGRGIFGPAGRFNDLAGNIDTLCGLLCVPWREQGIDKHLASDFSRNAVTGFMSLVKERSRVSVAVESGLLLFFQLFHPFSGRYSHFAGRLRLWCQFCGSLCTARGRNLHQGRGRGSRSGGKSRGGDPGGRSKVTKERLKLGIIGRVK